MDAEKYNKNIGLLCPTCGCNTFEYEEGGIVELLKCASCGREMSKDELIRENSENISEHVEDIKRELAKDAAKELREALKRAFKGSKNIKFK